MYMTDVLSERMVPRTSGLSSEAKALSAVWAKANARAHAECSAMVPSRFPVTDATAETPSAATMSRNRAVFLAEKAPCVRTTFRKLMETILEVNAPTLLTRDYASAVSRSLAPGTRRMNSR